MTDNAGFSLIEVLLALVLFGCLAAVATLEITNTNEQDDYNRTIEIMEDIRRAVIGRQDLYCNGQRQFSGYVADMGGLPALVDEDGENVTDLTTEHQGEQELLFPQPRSLWTRDINGNDSTDDPVDIARACCWKYDENMRIWAGWRGPYLSEPADGVLKDGWGNPLLFSNGELITLKDETPVEFTQKTESITIGPIVIGTRTYWVTSDTVPAGTYRCKVNWAFPPGPGSDNITKNPLPGFATPFLNSRGVLPTPFNPNWDNCWETLPESLAPVLESKENIGNPDEYRSVATNLYYGTGTLCVVSFGADGEPGGTGYNQDISMTIYPFEYMGEVAGMVGNEDHRFTDYVSICYPAYEQGSSNLLEWRHRIRVSRLSAGNTDECKNFRYGTSPLVGSILTPDEDWNINIPIGIRSIKAQTQGTLTNDRIYVFAVEPTGNFIGTIKTNEE